MSTERSLPALALQQAMDLRFRQAWILWGIYIAVAILLNRTIPFLLGRDVRAWTASPVKDILFNLLVYSFVFLVVPLVLVKGWDIFRRPAFHLPLLIAVCAMTLRTYFRPAAALAVVALAWLHYRYDLAGLGVRSLGCRADMAAVLMIALLSSARRLFSSAPFSVDVGGAFLAGLDRLFLNPASTTENLFYFGFLAERLSLKLNRWWTAVLLGVMYGFHEMTNPEYWYEGQFFPAIFIGIALFALIYLWRRSVPVIWLGDGLGRFLGSVV